MAKKAAKQPVQNLTLAGLRLRVGVGEQFRVLAFAPPGFDLGPDVAGGARWDRTPALVETRGRERLGHYGARSIHAQPGMALKLKALRREGGATGAIVAELADPESGLVVLARYQAVGVKGTLRMTLEARNPGREPIVLEQLMPCMPGLGRTSHADWGATTRIHVAANTWFGEAQWSVFTPSQLGIADTRPPFGDSLGAAAWRTVGTWNTTNHLPMGVLEDLDTGLSWFWQLETSGSWQMEVARIGEAFYVAAGGPSARYGDWYVTLKPGESYTSAPLAIGCVAGGFEAAIAALQAYRRKACHVDSRPDRGLPVFFNDYMNTLNGNPTIENEPPLIDAAAAAGADYYVIDAGWFDPKAKTWGFGLGDWEESPDRFGEAGLRGLCDYIRSKGMTPGLWAEIECVTDKAKVSKKPDSWFVCARGHRVASGGRMFLNFANPQVRQYAHDVLDRLRRDYGIGYLKLDYNADSGVGDDQATPSLGAGQVANTRGFYRWLEELHERHPDLIVENCGSGGMRFDYGLLSRTQVQSTSDQQDHKRYPSIMAGVLAAGLPEQMCIWSYPQPSFGDEEICLNLVTPMLARWHLSGHLDQMSPRQLGFVREAVSTWKARVRKHIPKMVPFWPTPLRHLHEQDAWLAAGLRDAAGRHAFVSVFRLDSAERRVTLPLESLSLAGAEARVLFPTTLGGSVKLDRRKRTLTAELPKPYSARLVEIAAR